MYCSKCEKMIPEHLRSCPCCGQELPVFPKEMTGENSPGSETLQTDVPAAMPENPSSKKPLPVRLLAALVAAALIAVVVFSGRRFYSGRGGDGNAYICFSEGKNYVVTDLKKGEAVEIPSSKSEMSSAPVFSADGRYVYFLTKFNMETWRGTLCRAEYGKLKASASNTNRNEKYVETVDTNVKPGFCLTEEGTLCYLKGKEGDECSLYYYDRNGSTLVDKGVYDFKLYGGGRILYSIKKDEDSEWHYMLYSISIPSMADKVLIVPEYTQIIDDTDPAGILYAIHDWEDDSVNGDGVEICLGGIGKKPAVVGKADWLNYSVPREGTVYFQSTTARSVRLSDYLTDSLQDSDRRLLGDYENYYEDPEAFEEAEAREEIREYLQDDDNVYPVSVICRFQDGKVETVLEDVVGCLFSGNTCRYNTLAMTEEAFEEPLDICDLEEDPYDLAEDLFYGTYAKEGKILDCEDGALITFPSDQKMNIPELFDDTHREYYVIQKKAFLYVEEAGLYISEIKDGKAGAFRKIAEDVYSIDEREGVLYCISDDYWQEDNHYCNITSFKDGVKGDLAKDIVCAQGNLYADGLFLAYTDCSAEEMEFTLAMFGKEGEGTRINISDNVKCYWRTDDQLILYIAEGDLYAYDIERGDSMLVKRDASDVWARKTVDAVYNASNDYKNYNYYFQKTW